MLVSKSFSKIFLLLLPLPLSTSSSQPLVEPLLVGLRPGSTLQPNSTLLLTCSLPSTPLPTNAKLNFTWSVDSRLRWLDPSPLHTQSHVASSWEYRPQTGDRVVQCSVALRGKKDKEEEMKVVVSKVEVKVAKEKNREDNTMVRLHREGSGEERSGRRRRRKRENIFWIPFRKNGVQDKEMEAEAGVGDEEAE